MNKRNLLLSFAVAAALVFSGCNNKKVEESPYNPETLARYEYVMTEASVLCMNGKYGDALRLLEENKFYCVTYTIPESYYGKVIPLAKHQQFVAFKSAVTRVVSRN